MTLRILAVLFPAALFLSGLAAPASAVGTAALLGTWEAARTPDDERLYLTLKDKGKVEVIAEYDFTLPGMPGKRRGRSTTFGKWSVKGDAVTITYAKVRDRLRYSDKLPLAEIGLTGSAVGLKPTGTIDPQSRIRSAILWKAPHEYKLKPTEGSAASTLPAPLGAPAQ